MNRTTQFVPGEEVTVTPEHFSGERLLPSLPAPGRVVHISGPWGNGRVLYSVTLLKNSSHGWYAGDTCRVPALRIQKV